MSYPKVVKNEIDKYLNAVRGHMQDASEEEVDEVILHLREQIDEALAESGDESHDPENIKRILSAMSQPASFASANRNLAKPLRLGLVSLLLAVVSWTFNLGLIPWFSLYGIVWSLLIAIAVVSAVISRKTVLGKAAMAILILEAISLPILHVMVQEAETSAEPATSIESRQE